MSNFSKSEKTKVPLYEVSINNKAIQNAVAVLRSGWLSPGKSVALFEKKIGAMFDTPYAVGVSSATDGLLVALKAAGIGVGDEVITSPFTFAATVEAIMTAGAKPILCDIEYNSLNIDVHNLEKKITKKTKAIIPVDIAGLPCDYTALRKLCRKYKLTLISDSAHTIGSRYKNKAIAHYTDMSVVSFHVTKNLISGEGGMILTTKKRLADKARLIANHGIDQTATARVKAGAYTYDIKAAGYKANMSELHASVGLGQLADFKTEQAQRVNLAGRYMERLAPLMPSIAVPHISRHSTHGWYLFIIKLDMSRLKLSQNRFLQLLRNRGVEGGIHYRPLSEMSFYQARFNWSPDDFQVATKAGNEVVTLPLYPSLTRKKIDYVCKSINDIVLAFRR